MLTRTVIFAALGYFVDVYDLVLFSILRVPSLRALGVPPDQLLNVGLNLMSWQMGGLLVGGFLAGALADRWGRLSLLLSSIILYSAANVANAFVTNLTAYAIVRFLAGVGLAGELGTAITLVSEALPRERRGYGTMMVAAIGFCGAVAAALVGAKLDWRTGYVVGGTLGFLLLGLRAGINESPLFLAVKDAPVARGNLIRMLRSPRRLHLFICCILLGLPVWLVAGVLTPFSPEICRLLGVTGPIDVGTSVLLGYAGAALGDFLAGVLSQRLASRKVIAGSFAGILGLGIFAFLTARNLSPSAFYGIWFVIGILGGYWAVLITLACEQFGTNFRATATTSIPNLIRGSIIPLNAGLTLMSRDWHWGLLKGLSVLTVGVTVLAFYGLWNLPETFARRLDFVED